MTTFTSDDREEEYKKILAEAPNQPGYEDAVPIPFDGCVNASPPHIVDSGASVGINVQDLANKLESFWLTKNDDLLTKVVDMLRMQEGELTEAWRMVGVLRKCISELEGGLDSSLNLNKAQAERYGNNEPVAWMQTYEGELNNIAWNKEDLKELSESIDYGYIPLYTHPAKTLTDEEIHQVIFNLPNKDLDLFEFARAILRKAQEK
jgi:hypothetical protein